MKLSIWMLFFYSQICYSQIYEVPCKTQQSAAYQWGTNAAYMAASAVVGVIPQLTVTSPPGAANAISAASSALLQFLWPMITGRNDHCVEETIKEMMVAIEALTDAKVSNLTLEEIRRWFDGHADTAKKIYEWIPVIRNANDEETRRDASLEFLKSLHYLYFSANEARDTFIEGSVAQAASFLFIRELAFLQFGVAAEIVASKYTKEVVKRKFLDDYREDVEYYWRAGHLAVEKLVKCLPNREIGPARAVLAAHLRPLFDFAYKFIQKNTSAVYTREAVYKPITSGDYVALRLDNGQLAIFESIFRLELRRSLTTVPSTCPSCGWDLFDDRYSPTSGRKSLENKAFACRDNIFDISNGQTLGEPIHTCDSVSINYRPVPNTQQPAGGIVQNGIIVLKDNSQSVTPVFSVTGYNDTTNEMLPCGQVILDRGRIVLTPAPPWASKVNTLDVVIIKAE